LTLEKGSQIQSKLGLMGQHWETWERRIRQRQTGGRFTRPTVVRRQRKKPSPGPVEVICLACGCTYSVIASRVSKTKFCSLGCAGRWQIAERRRKNIEGAKASRPDYRRCKTCEEEKPLSRFEKRRDSPDGYRFECRACQKHISLEQKRESSRRSHQKHKIVRNAKTLKKYYENHAANRAARRQWAKDHPEKIATQNRLRRLKNGDNLRARRRQHYRENQAIYVANARKREKRIKQATPPWANLKAIEAFYIRAAELSKLTGIKHHVDHIYPLKSPIMCGLHVEANLQILPAKVNLRKSNRIEEMTGEPLCCAWPVFLPLAA
jgi:hypothetical protein